VHGLDVSRERCCSWLRLAPLSRSRRVYLVESNWQVQASMSRSFVSTYLAHICFDMRGVGRTLVLQIVSCEIPAFNRVNDRPRYPSTLVIRTSPQNVESMHAGWIRESRA